MIPGFDGLEIRDLFGVDERLAVKSHVDSLVQLGFELIRVVKVEAYSIEGHETMSTCAHEHVRERVDLQFGQDWRCRVEG